MKKDVYLKIVLTLIAINLTFLTLDRFEIIQPVNAARNVSNKQSPNYGLVPLNENGGINVNLKSNDVIDVNIIGVDTWDNLGVDIKNIESNLGVDIKGIDTWDNLNVEVQNSPLEVKSD